MNPVELLFAATLVSLFSFLLGLLQRRTTRSVVLRSPRIGEAPRTELQEVQP